MGRPDSVAPTSSIAAGLAALQDHADGHGVGAAAPTTAASAFDTNVVIILAALFFALLSAIGLNSLARCALRYVGRGAAVAAGQAGATARVACSGGGIKRRVLRSLPVEVYGSGEDIDDVCAICLGEFVDGEKVRVLPQCGHVFHVRCVDAWLVSHSSCPTCRRPVIEGSPPVPRRERHDHSGHRVSSLCNEALPLPVPVTMTREHSSACGSSCRIIMRKMSGGSM